MHKLIDYLLNQCLDLLEFQLDKFFHNELGEHHELQNQLFLVLNHQHVTGTEGVSARRRNPTRPGPMSAMAPKDNKRNEEIEWPMSRVTGSSGSTDKGSLITLSGGARG